jgi:hypothetical protein
MPTPNQAIRHCPMRTPVAVPEAGVGRVNLLISQG